MSLKHFDMAAAGHAGIMTNEEESLFFKPALEQEIAFYNTVKENNDRNDNLLSPDAQMRDDVSPLDEWIPKYIGTMQKTSQVSKEELENLGQSVRTKMEVQELVDNANPNDQFIVLENVLNGYKSPNVMDIKLGKVLYDESASTEKKNRLIKVSRETTSGSLGFRICGIKMANIQKANHSIFLPAELSYQNNDSYISVNKQFGRRLQTETDIKSSLKVFFNNHEAGDEYFISLLTIFLERLEALIDTLNNSRANFISSSILLIFESDVERIKEHGINDVLIDSDFDIMSYIDDISDSNETVEIDGEQIGIQALRKEFSLSKLKLVDFGHSKIGNDLNIKNKENVISGLYALKKLLAELLNEI
ncbi:hypothetical protein ACO0OE_002703 [Hanseniaspora uvarum]